MGYVELHLHTEYSLLDGSIKIPDLISTIKDRGQKAVAITDHGWMAGVVKFVKKAKEAGIKPIIGCEFYWCIDRHNKAITFDDGYGDEWPGARARYEEQQKTKGKKKAKGAEEKDKKADDGSNNPGSKLKTSFHLIGLAMNKTGYANLGRLTSLAHTEGYYFKPRIDKELVERYHEGILWLPACIGGYIQQLLLNASNGRVKAEQEIDWWLNLVGNRFILEVQYHGMPEEAEVIDFFKGISVRRGIPIVATNDAHYIYREDALAHDALLCIQTGSYIGKKSRMRFPNDEFYMRTEEEMLAVMGQFGLEVAVYNTGIISDWIEDGLVEFGNSRLPDFKVPEDDWKFNMYRRTGVIL